MGKAVKGYRVGQVMASKRLEKFFGRDFRRVLGDRLEMAITTGGPRYKIIKRLPSLATFQRIVSKRYTRTFDAWLQLASNLVNEVEEYGYCPNWCVGQLPLPTKLRAKKVIVFDYYACGDPSGMAKDAGDILRALSDVAADYADTVKVEDEKKALDEFASELWDESQELEAWEYEEDEVAA